MKIKILCVGEPAGGAFQKLESKYLDLLRKHRVQKYTVPDGKERVSGVRLKGEARRLEKKINTAEKVVLLDEKGDRYTSMKFAMWIQAQQLRSVKYLTFVLGSSYGLDDGLKEKYPEHLGLSEFTLPHDLAGVVLLEQLYRAFCLLEGHPYHH